MVDNWARFLSRHKYIREVPKNVAVVFVNS